MVEFFSGVGRIAALATHVGFQSAAVDIEYGTEYAKKHNTRSPMDLNSNAGLMSLGCFWVSLFYLEISLTDEWLMVTSALTFHHI